MNRQTFSAALIVAVFTAASASPAVADDRDDQVRRAGPAAATRADSPVVAHDRNEHVRRAGQATAARADWLSIAEVASGLTARGYRVEEIELDDGRYEVEVRTPNGREMELKVDPRTGRIVDRDDD